MKEKFKMIMGYILFFPFISIIIIILNYLLNFETLSIILVFLILLLIVLKFFGLKISNMFPNFKNFEQKILVALLIIYIICSIFANTIIWPFQVIKYQKYKMLNQFGDLKKEFLYIQSNYSYNNNEAVYWISKDSCEIVTSKDVINADYCPYKLKSKQYYVNFSFVIKNYTGKIEYKINNSKWHSITPKVSDVNFYKLFDKDVLSTKYYIVIENEKEFIKGINTLEIKYGTRSYSIKFNIK